MGNISTNQRTDFDTYNPVDNIKFLGSTKLAEVDGSVVFSSIEHLYVVSAAVSAAENIQEKQAIVFWSSDLLAEVDGSKRIADVAENITRKSIVHVADYVVDVVESVTNVSNAENFSLFTEKGDIYIYIYIRTTEAHRTTEVWW